MFLICNQDGIIQEMQDELCLLLEYEPQEVVGQFIGILMNSMMSRLHRSILLPKLHSASEAEKKETYRFLGSSKVTNKPLIIYTKSKKSIYVHVKVIHFQSTFCATFSLADKQLNILYTSHIRPPNPSTEFRPNDFDMVILSVNIKDAYTILQTQGIEKWIDIRTRFHETIVLLIKTHYYPYLYLHEIKNDKCMLVVNLDFAYHYNRFSATMSHSFMVNLYEQTKSFIEFRAGISYGPNYVGYMDEQLKFMGEPMYLAAGCSHQYKPGYVCVDTAFYKKLREEKLFQPWGVEMETVSLEDIGEREVVFIPLDSFKPTKCEDTGKIGNPNPFIPPPLKRSSSKNFFPNIPSPERSRSQSPTNKTRDIPTSIVPCEKKADDASLQEENW